MKKVQLDVAKAELNRWFEASRIKERKIKSMRSDDEEEESIEQILLDAICEGLVVVDEKGVLTQKLEFPLESANINSLTFKARITVKTIRQKSVGIKANDGQGRVIGQIAARTGQNTGVIDNLDAADLDVSAAIIAYFL